MTEHAAGPLPATSVAELARLFLRLGMVAFGGPAAHIAMLRDEVVDRRKWLTDREYLDLLGVTNLIPGPNSTEMAIHIGYVRAGWRGLLVAGACFILPAFLMVLVLAAAYVEWGTTPGAEWLLYGVAPVVIAVIIQAIWRLGLTAVRPAPWLVLAGAVVAVVALLGVNELVVLFAGGVIIAALRYAPVLWERVRSAPALVPFLIPGPLLFQAAREASDYSHGVLFLTFLKIGALLYGSGYVLVAFLEGDFVAGLGWITEQELLDAVAIGQVTPGPVFTTATFIGYLTGGFTGALLATAAIFLPSFLYVALVHRILPRLRRSTVATALIDGINVAAIGLMGAVAIELAATAVDDVVTAVLAIGAGVALLRFGVNTTWLVAAGGIVGIGYQGLLELV